MVAKDPMALPSYRSRVTCRPSISLPHFLSVVEFTVSCELYGRHIQELASWESILHSTIGITKP